MTITRQLYPNAHQWANAVAKQIAAILCSDIAARGKTCLAVPGGRTASAVIPALTRQDIDWNRCTVTLTDERWVLQDHKDSNERLARTLLAPILDRATFIGLKTNSATPDDGLVEATARIEALSPLGCVLLGMGEDGHIASLFPGAAIQDGTLQTARRDDHPRISLTSRALLNARGIVLAINGVEKCAVLDRALHSRSAADLPVRHVLEQTQTPVYILAC